MSQKRDGFMTACLGILLAAAPVAFGAVPQTPSLLLAAFSLLLISAIPEAWARINRLPGAAVICGIALFGWVLLQTFLFSTHGGVTGLMLLKWLGFLALFLIVQTLTLRAILILVLVILLSAAAQSVYGLYETLSGREMVLWIVKEEHRGFATGTYINRNHLAGLLEMTLGLECGLFWTALRRTRWIAILGLGLLLGVTCLALFKTGSRVGMLSFGISLLCFSYFLWRRSIRYTVFFLGIFGGVTAALLPHVWPGLAARFLELTDHLVTFEGRRVAWQDVIRMICDFPWAGIGLGQFRWIFPAYQSESLTLGWSHAHNDYMELAAELGIPFFLVLMILFVTLGFYGVRGLNQSSERIFALRWGGLVSVAALSLHGMSDFNFAIPANLMIYIFIWAMVCRTAYLSKYREYQDAV